MAKDNDEEENKIVLGLQPVPAGWVLIVIGVLLFLSCLFAYHPISN